MNICAMVVIKYCFWILAIFLLDLGSSVISKDNRLLVVSFDGFRHDFFNRSLTPTLEKLSLTAHKSRLLNVFPTFTFPNHFSIATGLYVEDHGTIASEVMDIETNTVLTYGYKLFHYDENVTPIWTLNEMTNDSHHSGCVMWPGCDMEYRGFTPTYSVSFNLSMSWEQRINLSISWFKNAEKPANLVMLYFESPDQEEHAFGPDSAQSNIQIRRVDNAVATILDALEVNNLTDINVVLMSDHGMETVTLPRIINLTDIISGRGEAVGTSPVLQIYPKKGKLEELFSKLHQFSLKNHNFDVYKRHDIPDHYHLKNCKRAPPILLVAKPRYAFQDMYSWIEKVKPKYNLTVTNTSEFGVHGYDPNIESMQPFFIAFGPKFPHNFQVPNRTIDLFRVFADTLGLRMMDSAIRGPQWSKFNYSSGLTVIVVLSTIAASICLAILLFDFILFQRQCTSRNMGYTLVDKDDSII